MTFALAIAAADRGFGRGMRGHHPFLAMLCVVALVAAVAAVIWLVARNRGSAHAAPTTPVASPTQQAEAILAERLARGEIAPDDYRATLAALREPVTS